MVVCLICSCGKWSIRSPLIPPMVKKKSAKIKTTGSNVMNATDGCCFYLKSTPIFTRSNPNPICHTIRKAIV